MCLCCGWLERGLNMLILLSGLCIAVPFSTHSYLLCFQTQVLLAIDDYNALSQTAATGYGAWEGTEPELGGAGAAAREGRLVRRQLRVDELTLVSGCFG